MVTKFFSGYGEILESQIMRDPKTGHSRGCAFVKFASMTKAEEAKKLIEAKAVTLPGVWFTFRHQCNYRLIGEPRNTD